VATPLGWPVVAILGNRISYNYIRGTLCGATLDLLEKRSCVLLLRGWW
jgi:hypothetical protein